jgi:hypothetical protein
VIYILEVLLFTAVIFANIHWEWTPNQYLATVLAGFAVFVVFYQLPKWVSLLRRKTGIIRRDSFPDEDF